MDVREKLVELLKGCPYRPRPNCLWELIADHLIAHGVTVQEWISVKDRLPEDGVNVLWIKRIDGSQMIAKYEKRRNVWTDGYYYGGMNGVTHWMPLPQPPKGE